MAEEAAAMQMEEETGGEEENEASEELDESKIREDSSAAKKSEPAAKKPHPLENSWTLLFYTPATKLRLTAAWGSYIRPIYTFNTAEDFWRYVCRFVLDSAVGALLGFYQGHSLYNNIPHPSMLKPGTDLHCFKYKIEPRWEDPVCANGGKWTSKCARGKSDTLWLYTLLAMIGEQFDHGDEICGAVVSVRAKQERIHLWTKNAANEAAQLSIGRQWKKFLGCNETIGFIFHEDAKKLDRSAKNRYTV